MFYQIRMYDKIPGFERSCSVKVSAYIATQAIEVEDLNPRSIELKVSLDQAMYADTASITIHA